MPDFDLIDEWDSRVDEELRALEELGTFEEFENCQEED